MSSDTGTPVGPTGQAWVPGSEVAAITEPFDSNPNW
jgi:hypothetical protein